MEFSPALTRLFSELVDGTSGRKGAFILNTGDIGLLASLDKMSAAEASRSVHDGATIAAHAQHLRYGLSLMNRWATDGGDPFANATWTKPGRPPASMRARGRRFVTASATKPTAG